MFGLDPKLIGRALELGEAFLRELVQLNVHLSALRERGVELRRPAGEDDRDRD